MENGEVWVAVAYDGRVRVADPVPEARTFQKETGFQLLAARVNPTNVLVVQVVLTVKVYCVTVWLPDCHDPTWVWVSWTEEASQPAELLPVVVEGLVVGAAVAAWVGAVVGAVVGFWVGAVVGAVVGLVVGAAVGAVVGAVVGLVVGAAVGAVVGAVVGFWVGAVVGAEVGLVVGAEVGAEVGAKVGSDVAVLEDEAGTRAMSSSQMVAVVSTFDVMAIPVTVELTPKLEIEMVMRLHWPAVTAAGKLTAFPRMTLDWVAVFP